MSTSAELMCCFCPAPFKLFLEAVTNMRFDEEPNYSKLISLFDSLIEPCTPLRPIRIDGALKVILTVFCIYLKVLSAVSFQILLFI
jgi:hypothetical protein